MYRKQLQRYNHVPQALSLYRKMIHDIYEFAQMVGVLFERSANICKHVH